MPRKPKNDAPEPEPAPVERGPKESLSFRIPLHPDGNPNWEAWGDTLRESTKEKYRTVVNSTEFQKRLGLGASSPASPSPEAESRTAAPVFRPEELSFLVTVYGVFIAFVFSSVLKAKFDTIHKAVEFDSEQTTAICEALAPVVSKYVPEDWWQFLPEIRLGMLLAGITGAKFKEAKEAADRKTVDVASNPAEATS